MPNIAVEYDKEALNGFCRRWKVTEFSLFGSAVRDDFGPDSDVDVLVTLAPDAPWTLSNWLAMQRELETLFHRRVDLIERDAVAHSENRFRKHAILSSAVMLDVA
ncbi:MAG: nucleotidyltransferase domain-containing protein [Acidobacteria bacterium]|nr:nucleotidyltransferase domain-containing protein [Acidobacteriota bacterium]MBV9185297.1 nucleotidyltransferase domain-containing protein [Acidobacteriota bacterium]